MANGKQAAETAAGNEAIVWFDPANIVRGANSRYALKSVRELSEDILEQGGVHTPIRVHLVEGVPHLDFGGRRVAAVELLNREKSAGLKVPAIVHDGLDDVQRLRLQISENAQREDQSPMDKAIAIKQLLDLGVDKGEVRRIFSAAGGRKGSTVQPMSPAYLQMHLNFLSLLPKSIQAKIHEGLISIGAAYELTKADPAEREEIVARAEKARIAALDKEERENTKFLTAEARAQAAKDSVAKLETETVEIKDAIKAGINTVAEKTKAFKRVTAELDPDAKPEDKKLWRERFNAAELDVKAAQKAVKTAKNKYAKLLERKTTAANRAVADAEDAEDVAARPQSKPEKKAIGAAEMKAAATGGGVKKLTIREVEDAFKELEKLGMPKTVQRVVACFAELVAGRSTPKEMLHDLGIITGEVAEGTGTKEEGKKVGKGGKKAS